MLKKVNLLVFVFAFLVSLTEGYSQNVCSQTLKKAQKVYDQGLLTEVPSMLESCIKDGFTRNEALQAWRLISLAYIFQDQDSLADYAMTQLLKIDPEYQYNKAVDPAEFVKLYNRNKSIPWISIGVIGGVNYSRPYIVHPYGFGNTSNAPGQFSQKVDSSFGFQAGISSDIRIYEGLSANVSVLFIQHSTTYRNTINNYTTSRVQETQQLLDLPILIKYNFLQTRFTPYIQAGASGSFLINATGKANRVNGNVQETGPDIVMTSLRNQLQYNFILGGGLKYKLGYNYIVLDLRYYIGMVNQANPQKRYDNVDLTYKYGYADSDFKMDNLAISVGFYRSFYKTKRVKEKII
ncbi:MAG: PorT family protein [Cytophagales bacterium]|nr:PorT family protein [Cytophagales bacterium]